MVSRDKAFAASGVVAAQNLEAALTAACGDALRRNGHTVIVAGGGEIYAQTMPLATVLAITYVHQQTEGDARFPAIDPNVWQEIARSEHEPAAGDDAAFAFVTYRRQSDAKMRPDTAA